ncbi:MAG: SRPBCC family protein [Janthinobacterium lividum]
MNFEHLVQINDPLNPLIDALTREQLWTGLVLRAEHPQLFVQSLDSCTILSRDENVIVRELRYGSAVVRDRVTLTPDTRVHYEIAPTDSHVGGSLTMTIEQPDALQLFVRFEYKTTLGQTDDGESPQTSEIVKSAYRENDIDTVRVIRQITAAGRLAGGVH